MDPVITALAAAAGLLIGAGFAWGLRGRSLARVAREAEDQRQQLIQTLADLQQGFQGVTSGRDVSREELGRLQATMMSEEEQAHRAAVAADQRLGGLGTRIEQLEVESDRLRELLVERDLELAAGREQAEQLHDQLRQQACELAELSKQNDKLGRQLAATGTERDRLAQHLRDGGSPVPPPKRRWKIPTFFDP